MRRSAADKPLWTCPKCGAKFVTANMWHSCGRFGEDDLFAKCEPVVRKTYERLRRAVEAIAEVTVIPQKTRLSFQIRTRFIGVYPRKDHLIAGFALTERLPHPRFFKIEGPITGICIHSTRLDAPAAVDDDVKRWIKAALPYGRQERSMGRERAKLPLKETATRPRRP
jgi:hypothetical protein